MIIAVFKYLRRGSGNNYVKKVRHGILNDDIRLKRASHHGEAAAVIITSKQF